MGGRQEKIFKVDRPKENETKDKGNMICRKALDSITVDCS